MNCIFLKFKSCCKAEFFFPPKIDIRTSNEPLIILWMSHIVSDHKLLALYTSFHRQLLLNWENVASQETFKRKMGKSCPTFGEQFLDFIHKSCIFPSSPNSKRSYYWIELRKCGLSEIGQPFNIFTSQYTHFQFLILPPHFPSNIPLSEFKGLYYW